ncbi:MAG TPA: hypothetical protein VIY29_09660 [Ktedonobacteraceae bacterium]
MFFTLTIDVIMFSAFDDKAKDDHTLSIADTTHFALSCFQIFRRLYGLPDVVLALAPVIQVALHTRIAFKCYCPCSPHYLPGSAECKVTAGDELAHDWSDLHRRSFIVLLLEYFEMSSINSTALLEKVTNSYRAFVINDTIRSIDELKAKLR